MIQKKFKLVLLAIAICILGGCSSMPNNAPAFQPAPNAAAGYGLVYIYRLNAPPWAFNPTITVDDQMQFEPPEAAYTWAHIPVGKHSVQSVWPAIAAWPPLKFDIEVTEGQPLFIRISGGIKGRAISSASYSVEPEAAEKELRSCCKFMQSSAKVK